MVFCSWLGLLACFSNSFFVFLLFILANAVAEINNATSSLNSVVYELLHVALMLKVAT